MLLFVVEAVPAADGDAAAVVVIVLIVLVRHCYMCDAFAVVILLRFVAVLCAKTLLSFNLIEFDMTKQKVLPASGGKLIPFVFCVCSAPLIYDDMQDIG